MNNNKSLLFSLAAVSLTVSLCVNAGHHKHLSDSVIEQQRANLAKNTAGLGFGPQSPRNIDSTAGLNKIAFNHAPSYQQMHLCNIHFHKNAEHSGGEFTTYAGNGDGKGFHTGFLYSGELSSAETKKLESPVCHGENGGLQAGDTIELHYVHTSALINPGPTLGACLSPSSKNPQLRVEGQVYVVVNDDNALDFGELTKLDTVNGYQQALNIPSDTGVPVVYSGSTTGPAFNEAGSPLKVTWSMRPKVAKVNIDSVGKWCKDNVFNESQAHGVRNLVTNPALLSPIKF